MATQTGLFSDLPNLVPSMPEEFRYEEDIIREAEEAALVASLATLELRPLNSMGTSGIGVSPHLAFDTITSDVPWSLRTGFLHFWQSCGRR